MSKDLITGEIAVAIHLLEPTIIVSTCVVAALYWKAARQWLPTSTRGCCCFWLLLWDRVASLPQIVMTTAWQLGFFTATRCHHHGMVIKNIIQMFVKMLYLVFHKFLIFEFN